MKITGINREFAKDNNDLISAMHSGVKLYVAYNRYAFLDGIV